MGHCQCLETRCGGRNVNKNEKLCIDNIIKKADRVIDERQPSVDLVCVESYIVQATAQMAADNEAVGLSKVHM